MYIKYKIQDIDKEKFTPTAQEKSMANRHQQQPYQKIKPQTITTTRGF